MPEDENSLSQQAFEQGEARRQRYRELHPEIPSPDRPIESVIKEGEYLLPLPEEDPQTMKNTFQPNAVDLDAIDDLRSSLRGLGYIQARWLNAKKISPAPTPNDPTDPQQPNVELTPTRTALFLEAKEVRGKLFKRLDAFATEYPSFQPLLSDLRKGDTPLDCTIDLERIDSTFHDPQWRPLLEQVIVFPNELLHRARTLALQLRETEPAGGLTPQQKELKEQRDLQFAIVDHMINELRFMGRFIHRYDPPESRKPYRNMRDVWRRNENT